MKDADRKYSTKTITESEETFVGPPASSNIINAPDSVTGETYNPKQRIQYSDASYTVHSTRPIEPPEQTVSPEVEKRHRQSVADFPGLNLSAGEYVILCIQRHWIGLFFQLAAVIFVIIGCLLALVYYPVLFADPITQVAPNYELIATVLIGLMVLVSLGGYIAVWVYRRNVFFLTNESVIQEDQVSLFVRRERTVTLGSIEDAGFSQTGILQMLLGYGTIRLTIESDKSTYTFPYVGSPKAQTDIISNAIEEFKSGRPVKG